MSKLSSIHIRFDLDNEMHRRAWEYLQTLGKSQFSSRNQAIIQAIVQFCERSNQCAPENRAIMERCAAQLASIVEEILKKSLPAFISGYLSCLREASIPPAEPKQDESPDIPDSSAVPEADIDWDFLGG